MNRLHLRHVLCPTDLSLLSMNALKWANAIARARTAELRAVHVVVPEGVADAGAGYVERDAMMVKLRGAMADIDPGNDRVGGAVRLGDPGAQILRYARSLPADLIVMGAAGSDRPERPMGSVAATVVARADCPVLTVPLGRELGALAPGLFRRILCAVDPAPSSANVIQQALSLAWETHGRLTCACVMAEAHPSSADIRAAILDAIPSRARTWCDIEVLVERGVPASEIVKLATTSHADVVVIGPPRQWISTTQAVLAKSICPVLVAHDARPLPRPW